MKRLVSLISTEGKSVDQINQEVWAAYQKYEKVEIQVLAEGEKEQRQQTEFPSELQKQEGKNSKYVPGLGKKVGLLLLKMAKELEEQENRV